MENEGIDKCCNNCEYEDGEFSDYHRLYFDCRLNPNPFFLKNFDPFKGCKRFKPKWYLTLTEKDIEDMRKIEKEMMKNGEI